MRTSERIGTGAEGAPARGLGTWARRLLAPLVAALILLPAWAFVAVGAPSGSVSSTAPGGALPASSPSPSSPAASAPASSAKALGVAQVEALLLAEIVPHGKAARIGSLLRRSGYAYVCRAPGRGLIVISWYEIPKGARIALAHKPPKPVLIATGRRSFAGAASAKITVRLTGAGRLMLERAKRLKLTVKGSFAPTGQRVISALKVVTLKR